MAESWAFSTAGRRVVYWAEQTAGKMAAPKVFARAASMVEW